jgi:acyl carrier protein
VIVDTIQSTVKAYIMDQFLRNANPDDLTAETPLIEGGILDSLATVRLASFLEEQFGIELQPYDVNEENLGSLEKISALVRSRQPAAS